MSEGAQISPEPWPVHLLGLVNPCIVIAGNMAGGIYTAAGLVFMLGLGPILEILLGEAVPVRVGYEHDGAANTKWVSGGLGFMTGQGGNQGQVSLSYRHNLDDSSRYVFGAGVTVFL